MFLGKQSKNKTIGMANFTAVDLVDALPTQSVPPLYYFEISISGNGP